MQDKLCPRYLIFHQAVEPKDKDNLSAHMGRKAAVPAGQHKAWSPNKRKFIAEVNHFVRKESSEGFRQTTMIYPGYITNEETDPKAFAAVLSSDTFFTLFPAAYS